VELPRLSEDAVARTAIAAPQSLEGIRILVVEDDNDARELVTRVLRDFRAEVREASTVESAKTALREFFADLVVSDISMPGEDGYDLIRYLRSSGSALGHIPAIALTAFARDEDRNRVLEAGYQRHLVKPIDTLKLVEMAAALIGRSRPA